MRGVNKVILLGNLGKDPELAITTGGKNVCTFSMATTEGSKGKEYTEWHRIVTWDRLAEICAEYLKKGKTVYIEGSLRTRKWDDKAGNTRWTTEIHARTMQILSWEQRDAKEEPGKVEDYDIPEDEDFEQEEIPF